MALLAAQAEEMKFLFFVACVVGLYWFMRAISQRTSESTPGLPEVDLEAHRHAFDAAVPATQPPPIPELPPAPALGPVRVRNLYFATFDLQPGPPNPASFCDELFVDLENRDTGYQWRQSFQVATPAGIADQLREHGWGQAYFEWLLVVQKYDLVEIWRAITDKIAEEQRLAHAGDDGPPVDTSEE